MNLQFSVVNAMRKKERRKAIGLAEHRTPAFPDRKREKSAPPGLKKKKGKGEALSLKLCR